MALRDLIRRIGVRLGLFLTVALLPLGLIAVWQTHKVTGEIEERTRLTLFALTQQAAQIERSVVERSIGAANALAVLAREFGDDPARCSAAFRTFLSKTPQHSFAGFVPPDGMVRCSTADAAFDLSTGLQFASSMSEPALRVTVNPNGPISGQAVLIVSVPIFDGTRFLGYVSVSTPRGLLEPSFQGIRPDTPLSFVTFVRNGDVVSSNAPIERALERLPREMSLADLAAAGPSLFAAEDRRGEQALYAVAPILPGEAYAIGRWADGLPSMSVSEAVLPTMAFPIVMWLASLAVAYFAVHRVVIKHIRVLQGEMRAFALHRRLSVSGDEDDLRPTEFAEMHRTFLRTASILLRDEAELENALHQQRVLLKEVHHRVKNNLQLISSIMSMQRRQVTSPEARAVLQRLQDRILGLAAIHRSLYQSDSLSEVSVDQMLDDMIHQMVGPALAAADAVELRTELDPVQLYPDQVVPLSLLAAEALTNAVKHLGRGADGRAWIAVELHESADGVVGLTVANSRGTPVGAPISGAAALAGDGLGGRLIRAFAGQLGADLSFDGSADSYRLALSFRRTGFVDLPHGEAGAA